VKDINPAVQQIKDELKRQGIHYRPFAALFGMTENGLGLIMTGNRGLSVDLLYKMAEKLGIKITFSRLGEQPKNESSIFLCTKEELKQIIQEEIEKVEKQKEAK